jgi:hypothetical protein
MVKILSDKRLWLILLLWWSMGPADLASQQPAVVRGSVSDENHEPLTGATIRDLVTGKGILTGIRGDFEMSVSADRQVLLEVSFIGYTKDTLKVFLKPGEVREISLQLEPSPEILDAVVVESWYDRAEALQQLNIKTIDHIPLPSGSVESVLATMGAASRNEMSAQYSVRGGNYDENLIYVNDIEIYRPLTVKAGQQEGLSFINSSLVSSVQFAAGGFDARFGDKMSSVLDIKYKKPSSFAGSASASLLGASAHIEGAALQNRFTHITGVRYKTNQYLLNTLQTEGDYKPSFFDVQTFLTYDLNPNLEISLLGNISNNTYRVIPESRETSFGTYQQALNFVVYYEGQEKDRFATLLGALTLDYHPSDRLSLKLTGSGFNTAEDITYDILGLYRIDLLDNTIGSETAGDSILNIGIGANLLHARNYLDARILNLSHRGSFRMPKSTLNWGISAQSEQFSDNIREWEMMDSAGYSLPYSDTEIRLYQSTIARNKLSSGRYFGFLHYVSYYPMPSFDIFMQAGVRLHYLSTNQQLTVSPRAGIQLAPHGNKNLTFHAAIGWYHQPPFYKEMRDPEGQLHTTVKAQESVHIVLGSALDFKMWERPFRFTAELYYKKLDHLVPYIIDDVDIQYLPQYTARGYATGIEFKVNGEFVRDAESWATLSFLSTREDRYDDGYGAYPRPTDQLVNVGIYFQDYFPQNPSYRIHLSVFYGSRLPYASPDYDNPEEYYHLTAYRRIDIGLSKSLITDKSGNRRIAGSFIRDLWFGAEVFNLFGFDNQASYQWIRTVSNQEGMPNLFAVPNYLTGRLINLRLTLNF